MDSQVPAYWGIVACVGGLGLLYGIKKIGPYYLKGLEVASGVDLSTFARNFIGIATIVAAVGSTIGAVVFFVEGGIKIGNPDMYAAKQYKEIKEKEKEKGKPEQLQVLVEEQKQEGRNFMIYGSGAILGVLFLVWTGIVLLNYDDVVCKLNRDRNGVGRNS